jgi:hypothetical protein
MVEPLPEALPAGERLLWQGSPAWWPLARRAFHIRKVAIYFLALAAWRMISAGADGGSLIGVVTAGAWVLPVGIGSLGLLALLAYCSSRTTVYTITSRRLVMRVGIALPITLNIPFARIGSAAVTVDRAGNGDIPVAISGKDRIAYAVLWPHARPWRFARPEPMLRAVPQAERVARILSGALRTAAMTAPQTVESGVRAGELATTGALKTVAA